MKSHYYSQHATALRAELAGVVAREALVAFHRKSAARHLAIAARQFAILGLATWGLIAATNPMVWIPLAFVQGFTIFNFTVLLHEVVHHTVFERRRGVLHPLGFSCGVDRVNRCNALERRDGRRQQAKFAIRP